MTALVNKALLAPPRDAAPAAAETMVAVAKKWGVSPLRQLREMTALRFGPGKLASHEYYATGAFDPDYSMVEKKEFVGRTGSFEVNESCSPLKLTEARAFLRDKVMYTALLERLGLPTTETQAVVARERSFGTLPVLRDAAAIIGFFRETARYPVFAKPCEGRESVGSALITGISADGSTLQLGNGNSIKAADFAREVIEDYPEGFIFQTAIEQHPDLSAITGTAVGTLRVVTVFDDDGVKPLYGVWKIPSPRAMSDNFWQSGSMVGQFDDSGKMLRARRGAGPDGEDVAAHPASGVAFAGFQFPHWDAVMQVACEGHALFPEFGLVGWDMAVGPEGPIIVECNDNPFHTLYQIAHGRGIRHPEFAAIFDRASARTQGILSQKIATFQARKRQRAGKAA